MQARSAQAGSCRAASRQAAAPALLQEVSWHKTYRKDLSQQSKPGKTKGVDLAHATAAPAPPTCDMPPALCRGAHAASLWGISLPELAPLGQLSLCPHPGTAAPRASTALGLPELTNSTPIFLPLLKDPSPLCSSCLLNINFENISVFNLRDIFITNILAYFPF